MEKKTILSLFDHTGTWSQPYLDKGYDVIKIDIKDGTDIRDYKPIECHGILAAPPCTHFSIAGSRFWKKKDETNKHIEGLELIGSTFRLIYACNPKWWVLENPVGRLRHWIGAPKMYFNPNDYGGWLGDNERTHPLAPAQDAYQKKTCLWGNFEVPIKKIVKLDKDLKERCWLHHKRFTDANGKWIYNMKFKSTLTFNEKRSEIRSVTPLGFARAFASANP